MRLIAACMAITLAPATALAAAYEVPSLGEWGLLLLSLLLLTGGWFFIKRTSKAPGQQNRDPGEP
jgi:hypothetical protein